MANYRFAVITQYSQETLNLILGKLNPQIQLRVCFAEDRGNPIFNGIGRQIKKAVHTLGFQPCETVFLSGDPLSIETASANNLGTICWVDGTQNGQTVFEVGPDFIASSGQDIQDILSKKKRGYYSEVKASPPEFFAGQPTLPRHQFVVLENDERVGEKLFVGGRYFSTKDSRYQRHALSLRIINSKEHMANQMVIFSSIMGKMILEIAKYCKQPLDLITRVPPKPGQQDRIADQLNAIPGITQNKISPVQVTPHILKCTRSFPSQKGVGYHQRRQNVRGVFAADPVVAGRTVYVVDDILTSGSTLKEACNVLYAAGAKSVVPVAMAYHPKNIFAQIPEIGCNKCGNGTMKARCARKGNLFYGCSNYYPGQCKTSCEFHAGVQLINRALKIDPPS